MRTLEQMKKLLVGGKCEIISGMGYISDIGREMVERGAYACVYGDGYDDDVMIVDESAKDESEKYQMLDDVIDQRIEQLGYGAF